MNIPRPLSKRRVGAVLAVVTVMALALIGCGSEKKSDPLVKSETPGECPVAAGEALPMLGADGSDSARGCTIPEVEGVDLAGKPMAITGDAPAKVIVFAAHWCPHCQKEIPLIVEHLAGKPMPDDVELIGVSTSANPDAPNYPAVDWLEREKWTAPTLDDVDNSVAQKFGVSGFPFFVAVDAKGKVIARGSGELTMEQFDTLVAAAGKGSL